jgi:hypothetical protein
MTGRQSQGKNDNYDYLTYDDFIIPMNFGAIDYNTNPYFAILIGMSASMASGQSANPIGSLGSWRGSSSDTVYNSFLYSRKISSNDGSYYCFTTDGSYIYDSVMLSHVPGKISRYEYFNPQLNFGDSTDAHTFLSRYIPNN